MLLFGFVNLEYERAVSDHISIFAGPTVFAFGGFGSDDTIFAASLDIGARFFVLGKAPEGFWLSPDVAAGFATAGGETAFAYSGGGQIGYTWLFGNFDFSLGGGMQYIHFEADGEGISGILPSARLSLGAAF